MPQSTKEHKGIHVIPTKWVDVNKGDAKTRVPTELVRERTQTLGSDDARNICINGTVRVRDVLTLQSADVETWCKWCFGSEDLVLGCFQGTLSGGCDQ